MKKAAVFALVIFGFLQASHAEVDSSRTIYPSLMNAIESSEVTDEGFVVYKKTLAGLTCILNENGHNTCEIDVFQKNAQVIYDNLAGFEMTVAIDPETGYLKTIKQVGNLSCSQEINVQTQDVYSVDCYFSNF